jgi:hypothetical protein
LTTSVSSADVLIEWIRSALDALEKGYLKDLVLVSVTLRSNAFFASKLLPAKKIDSRKSIFGNLGENSSDHGGSEVHFIICHFSAAIFRQILRQNNDKN